MDEFEIHDMDAILSEVRSERISQEEKWGQQNHPDGTGPDLRWSLKGSLSELRDLAKKRCDDSHRAGKGTYESILTEEFFEALAEKEKVKLRAELIQVAAVAASWVQKIDRDLLKEGIEETHISTISGCKVSVNGQGHFPCEIH